MAKYKDVEIFVDNDGERKVRYTIIKNGVEEQNIIPYFDENNKENEKALAILKKSKKQDITNKLSNKYENEEILKENDVNNKEVAINKEWFKKHQVLGKTVMLVVGIGLGAVIMHSCGKEEYKNPNPVVDENKNDNTNDIKVEGAVTYISYEDAIASMAVIGQNWKDLGYEDVSQRGLNSLFFVTNYDMFEEETIKKMTENGVVSSDPMVIISDSLEPLSVCQDQGGKAVTGQDKDIINMTMFCVRDEDKNLVTFAYNTLNEMKNEKDDVKVQELYDSYYRYLNNEENTTFPIIYNEADKGVNYLLNQSYGGVFGIAGAEHGVEQAKVSYVEHNTGMNDFSSVIKEMQNCLNKVQSQPADSIVR